MELTLKDEVSEKLEQYEIHDGWYLANEAINHAFMMYKEDLWFNYSDDKNYTYESIHEDYNLVFNLEVIKEFDGIGEDCEKVKIYIDNIEIETDGNKHVEYCELYELKVIEE